MSVPGHRSAQLQTSKTSSSTATLHDGRPASQSRFIFILLVLALFRDFDTASDTSSHETGLQQTPRAKGDSNAHDARFENRLKDEADLRRMTDPSHQGHGDGTNAENPWDGTFDLDSNPPYLQPTSMLTPRRPGIDLTAPSPASPTDVGTHERICIRDMEQPTTDFIAILFRRGHVVVEELALLTANDPSSLDNMAHVLSNTVWRRRRFVDVIRQLALNPRCQSLVCHHLRKSRRGQNVQRMGSAIARCLHRAARVRRSLASVPDVSPSPMGAIVDTIGESDTSGESSVRQ